MTFRLARTFWYHLGGFAVCIARKENQLFGGSFDRAVEQWVEKRRR
jgi:hypothetical protein